MNSVVQRQSPKRRFIDLTLESEEDDQEDAPVQVVPHPLEPEEPEEAADEGHNVVSARRSASRGPSVLIDLTLEEDDEDDDDEDDDDDAHVLPLSSNRMVAPPVLWEAVEPGLLRRNSRAQSQSPIQILSGGNYGRPQNRVASFDLLGDHGVQVVRSPGAQVRVLPREHQVWLRGVLQESRPQSSSSSSSSKKRRKKVPTGQVPRQEQEGCCPICLDDFCRSRSQVVHCRYGCGGNVHRRCQNAWAKKGSNICSLCRSPWTQLC